MSVHPGTTVVDGVEIAEYGTVDALMPVAVGPYAQVPDNTVTLREM